MADDFESNVAHKVISIFEQAREREAELINGREENVYELILNWYASMRRLPTYEEVVAQFAVEGAGFAVHARAREVVEEGNGTLTHEFDANLQKMEYAKKEYGDRFRAYLRHIGWRSDIADADILFRAAVLFLDRTVVSTSAISPERLAKRFLVSKDRFIGLAKRHPREGGDPGEVAEASGLPRPLRDAQGPRNDGVPEAERVAEPEPQVAEEGAMDSPVKPGNDRGVPEDDGRTPPADAKALADTRDDGEVEFEAPEEVTLGVQVEPIKAPAGAPDVVKRALDVQPAPPPKRSAPRPAASPEETTRGWADAVAASNGEPDPVREIEERSAPRLMAQDGDAVAEDARALTADGGSNGRHVVEARRRLTNGRQAEAVANAIIELGRINVPDMLEVIEELQRMGRQKLDDDRGRDRQLQNDLQGHLNIMSAAMTNGDIRTFASAAVQTMGSTMFNKLSQSDARVSSFRIIAERIEEMGTDKLIFVDESLTVEAERRETTSAGDADPFDSLSPEQKAGRIVLDWFRIEEMPEGDVAGEKVTFVLMRAIVNRLRGMYLEGSGETRDRIDELHEGLRGKYSNAGTLRELRDIILQVVRDGKDLTMIRRRRRS